MPKIKFLKDYEVQSADGEKYKKGQKVDLSEDSCAHFVRRGAAEYVGTAPKKDA